MKELSWGIRKARVWFDELPDWNVEDTFVVEHGLPASGRQGWMRRSVAVELLLPIEPLIMYGALGAAFAPEPGEELIIQIHVSPAFGQLVHETLAFPGEQVSRGLPEEYVAGIMEEVTRFEETPRLGGRNALVLLCATWRGGLFSETVSTSKSHPSPFPLPSGN
jgi:hypothetical protein